MREALNCPNCGAPINGNVCPYCGTAFLDWANVDMRKPSFVKVRSDSGQTLMLRVLPVQIRVDQRWQTAELYANSTLVETVRRPDIEIKAAFAALPWTDPATGEEIYSKLLRGEDDGRKTV